MRRFLADAVGVAITVLAVTLVGLASRGRLPGLSWPQQYEVYLVLIGAMVGIVIVGAALAMLQNWIEK